MPRENYDVVLGVRLSKAQKRKVKRVSKAKNIRQSEYIRLLIDKAPESRKK